MELPPQIAILRYSGLHCNTPLTMLFPVCRPTPRRCVQIAFTLLCACFVRMCVPICAILSPLRMLVDAYTVDILR